MERIKQALDKARAEREQGTAVERAMEVSVTRATTAAPADTQAEDIQYSQTQVTKPIRIACARTG